jgi:hypothetical protein
MSIEKNTTNFKSNHQTQKNNNLYKQNTMAIKKNEEQGDLHVRRPCWD